MTDFDSLRAEIVTRIENTIAAQSFFENLVRALKRDALGKERIRGYARTLTEQHTILKNISKHVQSLLEVLEMSGFGELNGRVEDTFTGSLIRESAWHLDREKRYKQMAERASEISEEGLASALEGLVNLSNGRSPDHLDAAETSLHFGGFEENLPLNYLTKFTNSLGVFGEAVQHACKTHKPRRGNSLRRSHNSIRKQSLARVFIASYLIHFKRYPTKTENGNAHSVFVRMLYLAGLSNENKPNFSEYRQAIDEFSEASKAYREAFIRYGRSTTTRKLVKEMHRNKADIYRSFTIAGHSFKPDNIDLLDSDLGKRVDETG